MNKLKFTEAETVARLISLEKEKEEWLRKWEAEGEKLKQAQDAYDKNPDPSRPEGSITVFNSFAYMDAWKKYNEVDGLIGFYFHYAKHWGYDVTPVYDWLENRE